jgi:hypothetical protein
VQRSISRNFDLLAQDSAGPFFVFCTVVLFVRNQGKFGDMSDNSIILLEEGWRDHIKTKALEPLEAILEEGIKRKGRLFSHNDYINAYT